MHLLIRVVSLLLLATSMSLYADDFIWPRENVAQALEIAKKLKANPGSEQLRAELDNALTVLGEPAKPPYDYRNLTEAEIRTDVHRLEQNFPLYLELTETLLALGLKTEAGRFLGRSQKPVKRILSLLGQLMGMPDLVLSFSEDADRNDFAYAVLGTSSEVELSAIADNITAQTEIVLQSYAAPLTKYFTSLKEPGVHHSYDSQVNAWNHLAGELEKHRQNNTDNDFYRLRTLLVDELPAITQDNCIERPIPGGSSPYTPLSGFEHRLKSHVLAHCEERTHAFSEKADQILKEFDDKLLGKYPFAPVEVLNDAAPEDVLAFHAKHRTNINSLMEDYTFLANTKPFMNAYLRLYLIYETVSFLVELEKGISLQPMFNPESFPYDFLMYWGIRVGAETSPGRRLNPVLWLPGADIELRMKWAQLSGFSFENSDTLQFVQGGDWSLLRFAETYANMPPELCPRDVRLMGFRFDVRQQDVTIGESELQLGFRLFKLKNGKRYSNLPWPKRYPRKQVEYSLANRR